MGLVLGFKFTEGGSRAPKEGTLNIFKIYIILREAVRNLNLANGTC
jgi:hypothetical protein